MLIDIIDDEVFIFLQNGDTALSIAKKKAMDFHKNLTDYIDKYGK